MNTLRNLPAITPWKDKVFITKTSIFFQPFNVLFTEFDVVGSRTKSSNVESPLHSTIDNFMAVNLARIEWVYFLVIALFFGQWTRGLSKKIGILISQSSSISVVQLAMLLACGLIVWATSNFNHFSLTPSSLPLTRKYCLLTVWFPVLFCMTWISQDQTHQWF